MKRGLVATALAAPLALIPGVALATGSGGTTTNKNTVTIRQNADYDTIGAMVDVGLTVTCKKGLAGRGLATVSVEQYPPETPSVITATGLGPQPVVCDGKPHAVGVTIVGEGFDAGRAKATATLTPDAGGGSGVTVTRWISIRVV